MFRGIVSGLSHVNTASLTKSTLSLASSANSSSVRTFSSSTLQASQMVGQSTQNTSSRKPNMMSGHWLLSSLGRNAQRDPILPTSDSTSAQRALLDTRYNITHGSQEEFNQRAKAFEKYQPAEEHLLQSINGRMEADHHSGGTQPLSQETQLSADLLHQLRGSFTPDMPKADISRLTASDEGMKVIKMIQDCRQGPLTLEQSQLAAEVGIASLHLLPPSEKGALKGARIGAERLPDPDNPKKDTHQTTSKYGMELDDMGTKVRDGMGLPIMSGTSGSSSDMANAYKRVVSDESLSTPETVETMSNLSFQFMRSSEMPDMLNKAIADNLTRQHPDKELVPQDVPTSRVQTHTFPEVYSAVDMTLNGSSGDDVQAHVESNKTAKAILDAQLPKSKL